MKSTASEPGLIRPNYSADDVVFDALKAQPEI